MPGGNVRALRNQNWREQAALGKARLKRARIAYRRKMGIEAIPEFGGARPRPSGGDSGSERRRGQVPGGSMRRTQSGPGWGCPPSTAA